MTKIDRANPGSAFIASVQPWRSSAGYRGAGSATPGGGAGTAPPEPEAAATPLPNNTTIIAKLDDAIRRPHATQQSKVCTSKQQRQVELAARGDERRSAASRAESEGPHVGLALGELLQLSLMSSTKNEPVLRCAAR